MLRTYWLHLLGFILCLCLCSCQSTKQINIHSHNDYAQQIPFQNAYENKVASIEIDVYLNNGRLHVTHDKGKIMPGHDIETMYLKPLQLVLSEKKTNHQKLQVLVDFKSRAEATLEQLMKTLESYPNLVKNDKISFVISGNRPPVETYEDYPKYILFDYQSLDAIDRPEIWKKVALISLPYSRFSKWSGESKIGSKDFKALKTAVDKAHTYGKPFRFWGTPDTALAWKTFAKMGVDFINTDSPTACTLYFKNKN